MTQPTHAVIGAGPIGTALAQLLADTGDAVKVVTRSGSGGQHPGIEPVALDAADPQALTAATRGVDVIYNCANPGSYSQWATAWPPLAASILKAATANDAVLVTLGNLYGHGPVEEPMTRNTPLRPSDHKGELRAQMWRDALAAHEAGRVRVTEARASDYIGPEATSANGLPAIYAAATLADRSAWVFSDPDQPHTWTGIDDIAATLAVLGRREDAWGTPWLVPSNPPVTVRDMLRDLNRHAGLGEPRLRRVPRWALRLGGTVVPLLREVNGVLYQFDAPFVADASETTAAFGIEPTPWDTLMKDTARAWSRRATS